MTRPRSAARRRAGCRSAGCSAALLVVLLPALVAPAAAKGARKLTRPGSSAAPAPADRGARSARRTTLRVVPAPVRTGLENLEQQLRDFTLPNGLKVIVLERHTAPVFSFQTVVGSGSANDQVGTTGLAHMMEHMAFKGTPIVGTRDYAAEKPLLGREEVAWQAVLDERRKGLRADSTRLGQLRQAFAGAQTASHEYVVSNEFQKIIEQAGAQRWNAFTANDLTAYFYSMPSNRLELWALMEGGRMAHPVFREFYKERDVVYEERRMRTESSPVGRLVDEFIHASYVAHPYGFGGIGHPSDLTTFSRTQGDEYFRAHYVAKNMAVAVVGDVTLSDVQAVARKYFGDLSDAPPPPPIDTVEPEQRAERRVILEDPAQPLVLIGWHIPAGADSRYPAYKALADLLGGGEWARLNKALVKEKKIAARLQCGTGFPGERYPNQMIVFVTPAAGQDPEQVEHAVYDVLDEIASSKPFTPAELEGYQVRVRAEKIETAENNASLAGELAQAQIQLGDWHEFFREQERVQSLTVDDLMAAIKRSLVKSNRTVGLIVNPKTQAANQGGR